MRRTLVILLAVLLVLAMVPTVALADGETVNISTAAELEAAIAGQLPGQTWNIAAGVYDIDPNATITKGGQTGWYFPVVGNGITINGAGVDQTVITSSVFSVNGSWASQDMISVWGDDVTIQDLTIKPKLETNKAIEVMGKNVTIKNVAVRNNTSISHADYCTLMGIVQDSSDDAWGRFGGSVYFNPQNPGKDIGTATLDNVLITQAWISCRTDTVSAGTLNLTGGTTIDFRGSLFAGDTNYGVISSNPSIIHALDFTVLYDSSADEQNQIINRVPAGTTLIEGDNASTEVLAGVNPTFTIVIPAVVNMGTLIKGTHTVTQPFTVGASGVLIDKNGQINVGVANNPFVMTDQTGTATLAFTLSNATSAPVTPGGVYASFTADGNNTGAVSVDTDVISYAGSYSGTMDFVISYE